MTREDKMLLCSKFEDLAEHYMGQILEGDSRR